MQAHFPTVLRSVEIYVLQEFIGPHSVNSNNFCDANNDCDAIFAWIVATGW